MTQEEVNEAMRLYLGGGDNGGYEPLRKEDRLRERYGTQWENVQKVLDDYLKIVMDIPVEWDKESLSEAGLKVKGIIKEKFPSLDDFTCRSMSNYFTYQWK